MEPAILQVLVIDDVEATAELSPVLWAALQEVAAFYRSDPVHAEFRRAFVSAQPPPQPMADLVGENWEPLPPGFWQEAQGTYTGTYDPAIVCGAAAPLRGHESGLLVVTDREITPRPGLRYNIWRGCLGGGGVVSVAPTDPVYWGITQGQELLLRASIIKHRVRTSCLDIVGMVLGLERCENEHCFMFKHVDSVLQLDSMVHLGPEHDLPALAGRGFRVLTDDPAEVQPIVSDPMPEGAFA